MNTGTGKLSGVCLELWQDSFMEDSGDVRKPNKHGELCMAVEAGIEATATEVPRSVLPTHGSSLRL